MLNVSSSSLSIDTEWQQPAGGNSIKHFSIRWRQNGDSIWNNKSILFEANQTKYSTLISGLSAGRTYELEAYAVNAAGISRPALAKATTSK